MSKPWTYEQLNGGQAILSLQTGTNKFASQKGMTAFGMPRANISRTDSGTFLEPDRKGEGIVPAQCGTNRFASQKGLSPFMTFRPNICRMKDKDGWQNASESLPQASQAVIPMQAGTNKFATQGDGVVIGARRNQCTRVRGRLPKDRRSENVIPFQSGTNVFASQNGMSDPPGVGAYRQATMEPEGLNFTEEQLRRSSLDVPWSAGTNKLATQSGSGGFLKQRDVIFKSVGGKQLPEELKRKSDGILRLQFGTNKLASQSGMTGFGTCRNVLTNSKWKKEWVDEYELARLQWEHKEGERRHNSQDADKAEENAEGEQVNPDSRFVGSTVRRYGQSGTRDEPENDEEEYSETE
ncbi:Calponin domain containing protein [Trichuris trichiura]|uniref:Calponin domain containing protein n=1 Tax=Trichuris trichiura TaxID=36087 RepID=A0A077YX27_TRITR|nr:Calponin domain containing protein [Trichuris trichiura]